MKTFILGKVTLMVSFMILMNGDKDTLFMGDSMRILVYNSVGKQVRGGKDFEISDPPTWRVTLL